MNDKREQWQAAEQLALVLTEGGLQRMAARTLAVFLFTDQESVTAGEIAERLEASAGAVSGAVKSLLTVGLIERLPAPGSRREHYRLRDDAWATLFTSQNTVIQTMLQAARAGIDSTEADDPAHRRLTQMRDFYEFLLGELPALLQRWHQHSSKEAKRWRLDSHPSTGH
ncbi:GbsR/MarR family transcriptional regulator [Nonomuraea dietziae]|uniref:DNA-binding transcriptional regulator GbsR (MarR family) n=1 Tax=Nonomuraea dietziae TaxID=65515 RepID=A0A7W5UYY7_9ACTN|nr:helix-turn-helix domain-containing protein [Nonomuraea dietziae]MBB3724541.1 DNA-binding transcriptional regulator GbsR (MarR family) [Nonomuraea dietziae]